ncbi:MAG: ribose 5-phosphate isomerase B [Planctomycetota bacterium]|nr:ribose 5-phosphate isomerase B [Planctomycetota bacterium]
MKIALGSDHRGVDMVRSLVEHLRQAGHEPTVLGDSSGEPCDYPDIAHLVARAVVDGEAAFGILVCGSGIGMSMAANKVPGVRAALAHDEFTAEMGRRHNDANVLCMSGDLSTIEQARAMTDAFLGATFEGGRHARRVNKLAAIERGEDPAEVKEAAGKG